MPLNKKGNTVIITSLLLIIISLSFVATADSNAAQSNFFFKIEVLCRSDTPTRNIADLLVQNGFQNFL